MNNNNTTYLLILVSIVTAFLTIACQKQEAAPVIGVDPVPDVALLEDHSQALVRWARMGIRDAVVLHIDTHDDFRYIPDGKIRELENIYMRRDWKAMQNAEKLGNASLYNVGNFCFAAAKLGIVREVYWIIPFAHYSYPETEKRLRIFLKRYAFSDSDISTFRMKHGCFSGKVDGMPFNVCGVETMPAIDEPLLLSFDLDTLPTAAFEYGRDKTSALQMIFDAVFEKKYRIRDAVVSYSVNGGYMKVTGRWLGDEAAKVIANPQYRGSPLWSALQKADIAYKQKRLGTSMNELMPVLGRFASHPAVQVYIAFAGIENNRFNDAYDYAEKACLQDKNYCYALVEIGYELQEEGKSEYVEKFYSRGYELNPEMNHRLVQIALYMRSQGRYDEAMHYLLQHRKLNDVYPVDFILGETLLMKGNNEDAKKYFDSVRIFIRNNRYVTIDNVQYKDAIRAAYNFYMKNGDTQNALELRNNPKLAPAFQ
jgi:hypothetical protein